MLLLRITGTSFLSITPFFIPSTYSTWSRFLSSTRTMKIDNPGPGADAPGEQFEVRQTSKTEDYHPDSSKSLPLSPARQELLDDIIALYSMKPTIERVKRYTSDCVYDDQFVYANDRYEVRHAIDAENLM
jgi:hypothetical protein